MLDKQQGQLLISLARHTIEEYFNKPSAHPIPPDELQNSIYDQRQPVFITLNKAGQLRGCIGSLSDEDTIIKGVQKNSINAAFHDSRFPPVDREELDELEIEISLLSMPQQLAYQNSEDLIGKLRPGIDGVIINIDNEAGATFLPQVWEQLPEPASFLHHLCQKAGLPTTAWLDEKLMVKTYQVQKIKEEK